ncbi:hypothetical protein PCYB_074270, partial [Plasmodium cynomolgi strain B]
MLCTVKGRKWRNSNISMKELEESVQKLTEQVGYNDTSEEDEQIIISMELINRNILAFLRINKKAIRKWYEQCLSVKTRYWQIKMNFWRRFEIYTFFELFFGEKTRRVDKMWKNKMWDIWSTYINRMMWVEDVEDTNQFKKRINKCYSYIYIRDKYTMKKRHFRKVKQRKIMNAWNHFLNSYMTKWEKERKKQSVKKRVKAVSASSLTSLGQQCLQRRDDSGISSGSSIDSIIGGCIDSNV